MIILIIIACIAMIFFYLWISHHISYVVHKRYLHNRNNWDLNICCGKTEVGKTNADIVKHADVKNFKLIEDIYDLPFSDKQFDTVLCSHTMEHVDCPDRFFEELKRVGKSVTIILPPLYDISAALNFLEHKWIFLTFRKTYIDRLPRYVRLPGTSWLHRRFGQINKG
jgi:SAM-dependent methyltransferase